jgi:hypothetical protein
MESGFAVRIVALNIGISLKWLGMKVRDTEISKLFMLKDTLFSLFFS